MTILRTALVLFAISVLSACEQQTLRTYNPAPDHHLDKLYKLSWLEGDWHGDLFVNGEKSGRWTAAFSQLTRGEILSVNHENDLQGELSMFEFERFHFVDGDVLMTPYPNGNEAVTFTMESIDTATRTAVFVHPENDFPNRIVYRRVDDRRLHITVEGAPGGGEQLMVELDLERVRRD